MRQQLDVGKRIKELRGNLGMSQKEIAEKLSITQAAYSQIESSKNGIIVDYILILSDLFDVTTEFLLTGKKLVDKSPENGFVPFIPVKAHAGFLETVDAGIYSEDYESFRIPGYDINNDHFLFEIEGNSMIPTLFSNDVVICQIQKKINNIPDGSPVIVVTNDQILAKRFQQDEKLGEFVLIDDNPTDKNSALINYNEVRKIFIIRGKITEVLVANHDMLSKGKVQQMDEALNLLKRELFLISEKINKLIE